MIIINETIIKLKRWKMILTDRQIKEASDSGDIIIDPFEEKQIQAASYDLRIGKQGATASRKKLINIEKDGYLLLKPGDFAVITALEILHLNSQHVGRFGLRSKYARKGLIATTGPQIDPGYKGRLIIALTNPTPNSITLPYCDDFLTVEFHKLEEPSTHPYSGEYMNKTELRPEDIEMIVETESMSMPEFITTLNSLSQNIDRLTTDMKTFQWIVGVGLIILSLAVMLSS